MSFAEITIAVLVGGVLLLLYLIYRLCYAPYQLFKRYGIKGPTPTAFYGNYKDMIKMSAFSRAKLLIDKYGPVIGYYVGKKPYILITDLDMLKQILVKDFDNFSDHSPMPNVLLEGTDIFNSRGEKWKSTRKALTPSFSASKLKMMLPLLKRSTDNLLAVIGEKAASEETFEAMKVYSSFTLETILATAFGRRVDILRGESDELSKSVRLLLRDSKEADMLGFFLIFSHFSWLGMWMVKLAYMNSESGKAGIYMAKVALDLVKARRESEHSGKYKDILQLMIEASGEEGDSDEEEAPAECPAHKTTTKTAKGVMTDAEIVANSFGFLFAGNETTATTLSFVSYLLALNPDIQEKLQSEIDAYFEDKPEPSLYAAAQEITYLDNVIQETLRLYPPAIETNRYSNKTMDINGFTIPKDVTIVVPIYHFHHNPNYWKDPEKFNPDRFTAEEKANRPQLCHMPFGFGPRNCIGMRLALLETKIALIELLKRYTFIRAPETEVPIQLSIVGLGLLRAEKGISLKVINRL